MSFDIALSGLDATNVQLNTISNNIANVSTSGFKGARTEFSAVYNGMQPGGVEVASISQNFDKNGSVTGTGRSLDLAINGGGFFVTKDSAGQVLYTRSGVFGTDKSNYIVNNSGMKLQGYAVDGNNNLQSHPSKLPICLLHPLRIPGDPLGVRQTSQARYHRSPLFSHLSSQSIPIGRWHFPGKVWQRCFLRSFT